MNKRIIKEEFNGEQYELNAHMGCFGCMIEVDIKRVIHPNWKIFRTITEDTRCFFISECETIEEGCKSCFEKFKKEYEANVETQKKLNNFFKNA